MCGLVQSYRQNDMETILPSKESANNVEPAASICFQDWGPKSDHGAKIELTFMTNFVCLFTNILYKSTAYFDGGGGE